MKKSLEIIYKKSNLVILIGLLALVCILVIQVAWITKSIAIQHTNIEIHEKEDSLNLKQFSENTHVALRNALDEITKKNDFPIDTYGAVKQIRTNYFSVDISEELNPYYLENLLKRAFYEANVFQDFQYGIYDCFSDSIVFGHLIKFSKEAQEHGKTEYYENDVDPDAKDSLRRDILDWKKDGHYFTVFFPDVESNIMDVHAEVDSPWFFVGIIIIVVTLFFGYAIAIITKQRKLSDTKNDFINNMTHELKTPISTISLSSEMILKNDFTNDPERLKRYANIIYKENKRLENQVERVLNVAKLDKHELILQKTKIDIHQLILEAKETFEFNQLEHNGKISLSLNATNAIFNADPVHITNVIYNLLDNAIKYCENTPEISLKTKNEDKKFILEMSDNGIGMKKEDLKNIFEKFYRVPTGNLHNVKGFGLGLFYVRMIIEQHGGSVKVKSEIGKGTSFCISLPVG
jgi:two-component system, OmpR family, phosphate regulon sensor histidine kinase PhoR